MSRNQLIWLAIALPLLGACIALGIHFGWVTGAVLIAAGVFPDVSLIGAFSSNGRLHPSRVGFYNALHSLTIPITLLAIGGLLAALWSDLTLVMVGLAWVTHIAADRACGYRLRAPDGTIRAVPVVAA